MTDQQLLLIHAVKAVRYRFLKALSRATTDFGGFMLSKETRSPSQIIFHMTDVASKATCVVAGSSLQMPALEALDLNQEKDRFLSCLDQLLSVMHSIEIGLNESEKLLQGPILDMATHVGQLAMLSGLNGQKIPKEDYDEAIIE